MNDRVQILNTEILSDNWYTLKKISFNYRKSNGEWSHQTRESYDRGNGATILLYNKTKQSVILTRQFRLPTYINGNSDGMLIEACAGLLDNENPVDCIKRETEEETGFVINDVKKVLEVYMSPGSVTEILHFFIAEYSNDMRLYEGGGVGENEEIEVIEMNFNEALSKIDSGEIKDAKTIILLQYLKLHNIL
jgi:nudix-type nucleoside diphosphatase (YffH/AdpP family)